MSLSPMPAELIMALLSVQIHPDEVAEWAHTGDGEYTIRRKATRSPVFVTITRADLDEP